MSWWETRLGQTSTQNNITNNSTWWGRRYNPNLDTSPQVAAPIQQVQIPQAPTPQAQPNFLQRIGTKISDAFNVENPDSFANKFWRGAGGNALVGVQKNVVQPVADQLNPDIEGSLSQKFWMGKGGDFLVATQKAGETYKPVQVVDLQSKVEGGTAKFVVSIPETMANSAYNLVTGRSIADAGFTTGEDIRTGAILDPKVYFSDLGKVAGTVLDAYVIGGLIQGFGKAITKNVAKVFGKPTLTKIAEVTARNPGFWRVATKAGLQGGKFGLAYGLFGGLEAGRDTEDNKEYLINLALNTVGSGIMGFGVGFGLGGINYGIDKAMNHLFVSKTGTFTMKGTPDEVEMRVKEGGFENTRLGQDMLAAARYARQNGTDVGFQAYTLKQSPGGKIIGEDRVAKLFNAKNPAFEMSAVDQGGIYNFNSMPGTTNQNGMVYRFVEVPKDAANFTGDVRPVDPLLLTAPQTPANTTTGIVPSTPQAPITPEAPITTSVTPVVPAATKGITEAVVAPKTEVASVAPIEPTTPVVNEAPVAPKNEAEVKDLVTDDLKSEIPNYKSAEDFATGMINAYHGGKSEIETFDLAKAGSATDSGMWGTGFYLTNQSSIALGYANKGDTPGFVMDVFLDLKNPYIVRNANDVPTPEDLGLKKFEDMTIEEMDKASTKEYSDKLREYFISKGYDGVVANIGGGEYEEYVAFYPEQIKTRKQLENMWREGNKVASAKMTTKPVADLQVGESTVVPVDSADYRALAALDKNAYKVEAKDKFSKIVTKTAEPKVEPSVVKADTNKVENYLKDTYGKSIEKATKKELLAALQSTDSEIPYTPDIAKKFGTQSAAISMSDLELRPALLYGFANKHQFTDGYIAVVNPEAADKINDKNFEKIEKSKIKDYTKRGVTYSVAEEAAKKEIQEQKDLTESKAPKLESVVPKDLSEFSDLKPTVLNPDGVVILKGDGVVTAADADKYQFVANNLPGTVVQGKDGKTAITFVSDGKVQGLVMPMNIDNLEKYANAPVVETPVQEPLPKKITIGAKKTAKPVKKKVTIGAKKPKVGSAPLSTVAKNLLKNNPGITEADAEAMAKDIVANRKVATKKAVKGGDTGGYAIEEDYRGTHQAPMKSDGETSAPLNDLTGVYPDDIYSSNATRYYGDGQPFDSESISIIQNLQGKPNAKVTIYRAVPGTKTNAEMISMYENQKRKILKNGKIPDAGLAQKYGLKNSSEYYDFIDNEIQRLKGATEPKITEYKINKGDWVTINRKYAVQHGESNLGDNFKIIKKTVRADELYTDGNSIHEWGYDPKSVSIGTKKQKVPSGTGDAGGYADREAELKKAYGESFSKIKPIEMPELVQLAKELTGRTPTVTKKGMSAALGKAHTGFLLDITLRPDIFKTDFGGSFYDKEGMPEDVVVDTSPKEQKIARLVLAHEIGHITDALPDGDIKRGNELGRIGTLREFLRGTFSDPETEAKIDKLITELKDNQAKRRALRDPVLDENGEPVIVNKRVKYEITDKEADRKLLNEVKRINKEIEKLQENSIKNAEIRKELKEWTQYWKPFDENAVSEGFKNYRYSSAEMYADALSGLFNDPATLKEKAPKFWDGFFKFLDRKPKVEEAYNRIQDLINEKGDALYKRRDELINKAYNDAEAKFTAKELEKAQRKTRIWMDVKMLLDSKNALVNAKVDQAIKEGKNILDANNPKYLLEELQYIDGYVKNQIEDLFQPVKDKAEQVPDGWTQLGKILQLSRAITERGDMANPGGYDPKTATDQLNYLERTMPEKDWKILKEAQDDFRKAQQAIVAIAKENGFWNDETIASMEANPDYATYQVIDYLDTYITPAVKRQQGTLKDIANPATSSVIKAINVLRAIERNTAKRETIDFLTKNFGDELEKAPTKWNGKFHEVVTKNKPGFEMVKIVRNGKLEGYYVDPYIAKSLNTANDVTIKALSGIMRTISGASFYRPLFTSINLGFQTFNFSKDFLRYWKNLPDATLGEAIKSFPKAVGFYKKATKPSWDSATGQRNALIKEMENMKVLDLTRNDIYKNFDPEDAQIERTLQKIGLGETKNNKKGLAKAVTNFFNGIQTVGDFIERLPKVAGYMQLKDQMSEKELAHFVRTRLGSPNFREGGTLTPVTNSMFLFSNAIKEGIKTDYGAATDPKTKSGYWWKTFMANVLPKLLMAMAAYGIFGKKVKELMGKASEYDKTNYTVIPLGEDENGKAIYARLPQDESGRLVSAVIWKFLNSGNRGDLKFSDLAEVFSVFGGNIPSLAPNFTAMAAIGQYLSGKNPYDTFRGRNIISDDAFAAGVKYSLPELVNWLIQNNGGGIIIPNYTPGDTDMTTLQKVLSVPGLSNILGRWIKVSDYGQTEQLREISNEAKSEAAVKRIEKNKSIDEAYNDYKKSDRSDEAYKEIATKLVEDVIGKPLSEIKGDEATEANAVLKSLNRTIIKGRADPEVNALIFARSNAEKAELLVPILAGMKQKEAADFIKQMVDEKIITTDVLSKYSELQK